MKKILHPVLWNLLLEVHIYRSLHTRLFIIWENSCWIRLDLSFECLIMSDDKLAKNYFQKHPTGIPKNGHQNDHFLAQFNDKGDHT